jgi:hypothetical protein
MIVSVHGLRHRLIGIGTPARRKNFVGNQTVFSTARVRPPHAPLPAAARAWGRSARPARGGLMQRRRELKRLLQKLL